MVNTYDEEVRAKCLRLVEASGEKPLDPSACKVFWEADFPEVKKESVYATKEEKPKSAVILPFPEEAQSVPTSRREIEKWLLSS